MSGRVTLSNLVLSATSRSEADMLPMSSRDEDWERRLLEPCTVNLFRLEVEPVNFPELPCRPTMAQQMRRHSSERMYFEQYSHHRSVNSKTFLANHHRICGDAFRCTVNNIWHKPNGAWQGTGMQS